MTPKISSFLINEKNVAERRFDDISANKLKQKSEEVFLLLILHIQVDACIETKVFILY